MGAVGEDRVDQAVALLEQHGVDPGLARMAVGGEHGLLDQSLAGRAHQVVLVVELLHRDHRLHALLAAHALEVVHERPALRHAPGLLDLVHL